MENLRQLVAIKQPNLPVTLLGPNKGITKSYADCPNDPIPYCPGREKCASKTPSDVFHGLPPLLFLWSLRFSCTVWAHRYRKSYPALKRLYSLLKSNRRSSVYTNFAKTFASNTSHYKLSIFSTGFLKNFLTFSEHPHL